MNAEKNHFFLKPETTENDAKKLDRFSPLPNCRALTLLELLVVMGAIAIISALGFGISSSAIERGRQAKCINNLRQIGVSIVNYARDDDDSEMPPVYELKLQGGGKWKLFARFQHSPSDILNFVDPSLLVCPSDKKPAPFQATDPTGKTITVPCSYGFNFVPAVAGVRFTTLEPKTLLVFDGQLSSSAQSSHWFGDAERPQVQYRPWLSPPR